MSWSDKAKKKQEKQQGRGVPDPQIVARFSFCRLDESPGALAAGGRVVVIVTREKVVSQTCQYMFG